VAGVRLDGCVLRLGLFQWRGDAQPPSKPRRGECSRWKIVHTNLSCSVTVLNLTDRHLLVDNSLTFGGFHYNNPREIYAQLRYRF
jgi:hypothetical protein